MIYFLNEPRIMLIDYLLFGNTFLKSFEFCLASIIFLGLKILLFEAGYFLSCCCGRIGRATKFPEQLGQTFSKISKAQFLQ